MNKVLSRSCLRRGFRGLLCLSALLSVSVGVGSVQAASVINVRPNAYGVYRVNEAHKTPAGKAELPTRDVELTTDYKATMAVSFPNGMNWQLGERSRVLLDVFEYNGPTARNEPRQVRWNARDNGGMRQTEIEQSSSSWTATLQSGELAVSCLEPEGGSQHTIATPDARVYLRAISASISRTATEGTSVNVYDGSATITLPDGRVLNYGTGTTINVSPKGEVKISRVSPGAWMWMPAAKGARAALTAAGFPYMPLVDQTVLVSPSS